MAQNGLRPDFVKSIQLHSLYHTLCRFAYYVFSLPPAASPAANVTASLCATECAMRHIESKHKGSIFSVSWIGFDVCLGMDSQIDVSQIHTCCSAMPTSKVRSSSFARSNVTKSGRVAKQFSSSSASCWTKCLLKNSDTSSSRPLQGQKKDVYLRRNNASREQVALPQ